MEINLLLSLIVIYIVSSLNVVLSLDFLDAYSWKSNFPQACTCMENGVTKAECTLFQCDCICDVTAGLCDYNCCCDPDCSSEQVSRFEDLDVCAYDGKMDLTSQFCYSSVNLYTVNPESPMTTMPTAENGVGGALCVEKTNYALEGQYYINVEQQSNTIFTSTTGQKSYDYIEEDFIIYESDSFYDQNDTISVYSFDSGSSSYSLYMSGLFQVPASDFTGNCIDNNIITFENNIEKRNCHRQVDISSFESSCNSVLSVSSYVSDLYILATATPPDTGVITASDVVQITLAKISYDDVSSPSHEVDITALWTSNNCSTSYLIGYEYLTSSCSFSSTPEIYNMTESNVCQNIVKSITYTVTHDDTKEGTITSVTASVVVSDALMTPTKPSINIIQSFSGSFESSNSDSAVFTKNNGNLVKRIRSGNPGYVTGLPILFGTLQENVAASVEYQTIVQSEEGLKIPTSLLNYVSDESTIFGTSTCPYGLDAYIPVNQTGQGMSIKFGYDTSTGCIADLTKDQLIAMCCEGSENCDRTDYNSSYTSSTGVPFFFNIKDGYVGIYGNADPLDYKQWLEMKVTLPIVPRQWNADTNTCQNMLSGLQYEFLISNTGEKRNPQSKIISVSVSVISSDWKWRSRRSDASAKYALSITSTFVYKNAEELLGYAPPAPLALFKLPYDVFYPFLENPGEKTNKYSFFVTLLLPFICIIATLLINY